MQLFSKLTTEGTEEVKDVVGGGRQLLATDVYEKATLKMAYAGQSDGGAHNMTYIFDVDGTEYEETIYITNKQGDNTYTRDGKKQQMPGFVLANELALAITNDEISSLAFEERQVEVWNFEEKKKVREARQVPVDMLGGRVHLAIQKIKELKQKKNDDGKYVDSDQVIEKNEIKKIFHAETSCTINEIREALKNDKEPESTFLANWKDRWAGKDIDRTSGKGSAGAKSGAPAGGGSTKPVSGLFAKKK